MEKATRDQADVDLLGHSCDKENHSSQKRQAFDSNVLADCYQCARLRGKPRPSGRGGCQRRFVYRPMIFDVTAKYPREKRSVFWSFVSLAFKKL